MKTIEEKNRIIAEFMGVYSDDSGYNYSVIGNTGIKYHTSWDWLMPVIEEIDHHELESDRLTKFINDERNAAYNSHYISKKYYKIIDEL